VRERIHDEVLEEFEVARADAGLAEDPVRMFLMAGDPLTTAGPWPVHVLPGRPVEHDLPVFDAAARAEANDASIRDHHRIAVRAGIATGDEGALTVVSGLIRHELEHALQYRGDRGQEVWELDWIADCVAAKLDEPGGNAAYRSKPSEAGANAAASCFLCWRHPAARATLAETPFAPFCADADRILSEAVPRLTVEWLRERRSCIDARALFNDGRTWPERLEAAFLGATTWWDEAD
jgi:hypothetical protein